MPTSASSMRLSCAEPNRFAPISLAKPPLVCARGRLRTPEPVFVAEDNWLRPGTAFGLSFPALSAGPLPLTSRGRLRPPGASRHSASRVRWRLFLPPSASSKHLSCADPSRFAPISLHNVPPVCAGSPLRTRNGLQSLSAVAV